VNWTQLAQKRDKWRALVNKGIDIKCPWQTENFSNSRVAVHSARHTAPYRYAELISWSRTSFLWDTTLRQWMMGCRHFEERMVTSWNTSSATYRPLKIGRYDAPNRRDPATHWRSVLSQKNGMVSYIAATTWSLIHWLSAHWYSEAQLYTTRSEQLNLSVA
jgi:hypothetical protein